MDLEDAADSATSATYCCGVGVANFSEDYEGVNGVELGAVCSAVTNSVAELLVYFTGACICCNLQSLTELVACECRVAIELLVFHKQ